MERSYRNSFASSGFTLVELAIVLVVIGLVVGGVVLAVEMIHTARIQKTATLLTKIDLALSTFRLKYGCEAGDCIASRIGLGNGIDGDGNGDLSALAEWPTTTMPQLVAADLFDEGRTTPISLPIGNGGTMTLAAAQTQTLVSETSLGSGYYRRSVMLTRLQPSGNGVAALKPIDARRLDILLDDGHPQRGRFFVSDTAGLVGSSPPYYLTSSGSLSLTNNNLTCLVVAGAMPAQFEPIRYNTAATRETCIGLYDFGVSR